MPDSATNLTSGPDQDTEQGTRLVRVRYFAGARAAAGVAEEDILLPAADPATRTVAAVLAAVRERQRPALDRVLAGCSFLLNGVAVHDRSTPLPDDSGPSELDVLPPFAGG